MAETQGEHREEPHDANCSHSSAHWLRVLVFRPENLARATAVVIGVGIGVAVGCSEGLQAGAMTGAATIAAFGALSPPRNRP